jgi:DNA-binding IclR family transcriptional regulator
VRDTTGRVVAAVSVSGPIQRLSRRPGARFGDLVAAAAAQVEAAIGS